MTDLGRAALRRRVERRVLRAQGRLDSDAADRFVPWVFALVVFALFAVLHAARARGLDGGSGAAPWIQAVWRREHGSAGFPMAGVDPARGSWSFVSEPILWLGRYVDPTTLFVVLQALALALTVLPLWRLARREAHLRVGATSVVVVAFALAPTLHRANLGSFHPELLAVPALVEAYYRALHGQWARYGVLVTFAMACRADIGLTVAVLGLVLVSTGRRRPGLVSVLVGLAWPLIAVLALSPQLPDGPLTPAGEFVARSTSPLAVYPDLVRHPLSAAHSLLAEPSVLFLVVILAPLLFLPLVAPRRLVIALPAVVLAMVADRAVQRFAARGVLDLSPAAAHIGPAIGFVFVALVFALERIGDPSVTRVNVDRRVLLALLAGATLLFVTEAPSSPYRHPWEWASRDAGDQARIAAADLVADAPAVAASPSLSALVADRGVLVELPPDPGALTGERIEDLAQEVDAVVLDTTAEATTDNVSPWTPARRAQVRNQFVTRGFTVAFDDQAILVLVRR